MHGEHQSIRFEQRPGDVGVGDSQLIASESERSILSRVFLLSHQTNAEGWKYTPCTYVSSLQISLEETQEGRETELVHVVGFGQIGDDEEHLASVLRQW